MASSNADNLKNIFKELNVGVNGFLDQEELSIVCQHIGMPKMTNKELSQLFKELDKDSNGKISLDEFVAGILDENPSGTKINLDPNDPDYSLRSGNNPSSPEQHNRSNRFTINPNDPDYSVRSEVDNSRRRLMMKGSRSRMGSSISSKFNWLKSLAANDETLVDPQILVDFWNKCSIPDGLSILELLGLNNGKKLDLRDLSSTLEQELRTVADGDNVLPTVTVDSMCAIIASLQSEMEDLIVEKEQLRLEAETSKKLASDVADDADEFIAKLEKHKNEEIKHLTEQLTRKSSNNLSGLVSGDVQLMADQLSILKRENNELREKIVTLEHFKAENERKGTLKENNLDEVKRLQTAFSLERKELRDACMLEISEAELKFQQRIEEIEKEKQDIQSFQQRRIDEALAEKERDLLSEFVKESMKEADRLKAMEQAKSTDRMVTDSNTIASLQAELKNALKDKEDSLYMASRREDELKNQIQALEKDLDIAEKNYRSQIEMLRANFDELKKGMAPLKDAAEVNKLVSTVSDLEKKNNGTQ